MLTVLCPDTPIANAADPRWPDRLHARLARSRVVARHHDSAPVPASTPWENWLADRFALADSTTAAAWQHHDWARADTIAAIPDDAAPHCLYTVVPASLHAGMDHLVFQGPQDLAVTRDEAQALALAANQHLATDGIRLVPLTAAGWLLQLAAPMQLTLHSSFTAHGRSVDAYMPAGPDARALRRVLNEMQMLWHEHPVNEQRLDQGLAPINTIWVEGRADARAVDELPASTPHHQPFAQVFSDHPVTRGLAIGHGLSLAGSDAADTSARIDLKAPCLVELRGDESLRQLQILIDAADSMIEVVLTDDRQWISLRCAPADRLRFWRNTRLVVDDT